MFQNNFYSIHFTKIKSALKNRCNVFSVALVTEMQTTEPETDNIIRKFYGFIQSTYKIGGYADISVLVGSRQAGNICIGGVCRYEPEFKGVELKLLTRL